MQYERWSQAAGTSPQTLRLRLHYLTRLSLAADRPLLELTADDLSCFLAHPSWAPETRRSARSAIRSFFRWAVDTEQLSRDPSRALPNVRVPTGRPRPTPEAVFIDALLTARPRERLMILLAGYAGLRRSEIARVHTDHIQGGELRVVGKGGRVRMVPLHPRLELELHSIPAGWAFPGHDQGHLTPGHVGYLIKKLLGPDWTAHTLRHRFATRAYSVDRDLLAVQTLLGHSKPETTRRYTAIPDGALTAAVMGV
jgi:integrase